jgi:hypothetical protein
LQDSVIAGDVHIGNVRHEQVHHTTVTNVTQSTALVCPSCNVVSPGALFPCSTPGCAVHYCVHCGSSGGTMYPRCTDHAILCSCGRQYRHDPVGLGKCNEQTCSLIICSICAKRIKPFFGLFALRALCRNHASSQQVLDFGILVGAFILLFGLAMITTIVGG